MAVAGANRPLAMAETAPLPARTVSSVPAVGPSDIDPIEATDGPVRAIRRVELRGLGLLVTLRISVSGASPVACVVVDRLPSRLDVEAVGFHPAAEPAQGHVDDRRAAVAGLVEPGDAVVVRYGICPARPRPPAAIRTVQAAAPFAIERADPVDPASFDPADLERAVASRGDTTPDSIAESAGRLLVSGLRRWVGRAGRARDSTDPDPSPVLTGQSVIWDGGVASQAEGDDAPGSAPRGDETEPSAGDADVVEAFIQALEAEGGDDVRRRCRQEVRELLGGSAPPARTDVRLRDLEERVDRVGATADAMASVIDRHGPLAAFRAQAREDLEALASATAAVRAALADGAAGRASLDGELQAVADETARLTAQLDRLEVRFESTRAAHRSSLAAVDRETDDLSDRVSRAAAFREAMSTMRSRVDELQARRDALVATLTETYPDEPPA